MFSFAKRAAFLAPSPAQEIVRPYLDLSGAVLAEALRTLIAGTEALGGVERYVEAVKLKSAMFKEAFENGAAALTRLQFLPLCAFMPTVRRRIAPYLDERGFARIRDGMIALTHGDAASCDKRVETFCALFPDDREHRFISDLAGEVLHNVDPGRYPMMARWIWDAKANTGVIRELWHGEDVDHMSIPAADGYATFLTLREELAEYLTENGVFKDVIWYVDMLCAQTYANYICSQGGSYLRTDFSAPQDPMEHTRRLLGLDGVRPGSSRSRLKAVDGEAYVIEDINLLT